MSSAASPLHCKQTNSHESNPQGNGKLTPSHSATRPTGKGRRRRAAAEQRELDLQQWCGELGEHLSLDAPVRSNSSSSSSGDASPRETAVTVARSYEGPRPPGTRRQQRKASRRAQAAADAAACREEIEEHFAFEYARSSQSLPRNAGRNFGPHSVSHFPSAAEQEEFELAMAVSLSLSDSGLESSARAIQRTLQGDLSYENLVNLEGVPRALPAAALESLGTQRTVESACDEVCPICLGELVEGDSAVELPCSHMFHSACCAEWLLKYSSYCPVCKKELGQETQGECCSSSSLEES